MTKTRSSPPGKGSVGGSGSHNAPAADLLRRLRSQSKARPGKWESRPVAKFAGPSRSRGQVSLTSRRRSPADSSFRKPRATSGGTDPECRAASIWARRPTQLGQASKAAQFLGPSQPGSESNFLPKIEDVAMSSAGETFRDGSMRTPGSSDDLASEDRPPRGFDPHPALHPPRRRGSTLNMPSWETTTLHESLGMTVEDCQRGPGIGD